MIILFNRFPSFHITGNFLMLLLRRLRTIKIHENIQEHYLEEFPWYFVRENGCETIWEKSQNVIRECRVKNKCGMKLWKRRFFSDIVRSSTVLNIYFFFIWQKKEETAFYYKRACHPLSQSHCWKTHKTSYFAVENTILSGPRTHPQKLQNGHTYEQ